MRSSKERSRKRQRAALLVWVIKFNLRMWRRSRQRSARQRAVLVGSGLAAGAALEYFLDPASGSRRRAAVMQRIRGVLRRPPRDPASLSAAR